MGAGSSLFTQRTTGRKTAVLCSLLPNNTGALLQFVTSTLANGTLSTSLHLRHLKRSPPKTTDL